MRFRRLSRYAPYLIAGILLAVLAVLAVHQYHWIHNVSVLHRQRMRQELHATGTRFSRDFNREVTRAFLYFHPDFSATVSWRERAAQQLERWRAEAPYPRLVRDVFAVRRTDSVMVSRSSGRRVRRSMTSASMPVSSAAASATCTIVP